MLGFCISLSVLLITAFALMYLGPTVQNFLPDGGDTRKLATLLLAVTAVCGAYGTGFNPQEFVYFQF